ncbi:type II secretion system minor pseudopilin GspH [Stenotrophomonas terrae]|uniref:type II secretion system minor pseudopilin GspH n=1 Tax=Stenotrophomonas terrae TaxID=405446 RepID=UPI000A41C1B4|nr:type II secretion system minor pseudopilin GspH [Stenotrophomonas terrae]
MVRARGFTLVEVLVVVVIVGVLAAAVGLVATARGDGYALREEAERLAAVVRLLADEAVLDNREYGIRVSAQGYEMRAYDNRDGRWHAQPGWAPRQLPDNLQLLLEGAVVALPASPGADAAPQIVLSSSAQWTPFSARIKDTSRHGLVYRIDSDGMSEPLVQQVSPP